MKLPTILLLNGLLQYQPAILTPLGMGMFGLRPMLEEMGFRVITDTHLALRSTEEEPVAVIGHSAGGGAALKFAEGQVRNARFHPIVITFDAVPPYKCPTRCFNFKSAAYWPVPGATNILVDLPFSHTYMVLAPSVKMKVKSLVVPLTGRMQ